MLVHFWQTRETSNGVRVPIVGRLRFRATLAGWPPSAATHAVWTDNGPA